MGKRIHRNIRLLAAFNFLNDFRLYAPIAILYFAKVSGSFALGMSVFSITMLSQAVLEIPTGVFSDIIGRKKRYCWEQRRVRRRLAAMRRELTDGWWWGRSWRG